MSVIGPAASSAAAGRRRSAAYVAIGFALALVVVAVARLALFGWAGLAPDDARYVYVGLSTLDGHGPVTPTGNVFLLRSPVYGILLAAGGVVLGDGPVAGARIVAAILTIAGMLAAVRLGWVLGGPVGAAATALAVLAMPLVWRLLPTLRVDLPQTAGVIAVLLALLRPTLRRWALAGAVLGLTVLVKETILLLALAPLAFVGTMPAARLARLWAVFIVVAAVVAGWWWILVWTQSGAIFPLNAIGVIDRRDVGSDLRLDTFGVGLLGLAAIAWLIVLVGARRDPAIRLLAIAAACLIPPAAYATLSGLNARNYAGLAVLSAVALGVALARIVAYLTAGGAGRRGAKEAAIGAARPFQNPAIGAALLMVAAILGIAGPIAGQARVGDPDEPELPTRVADWLRAESPRGSRAVMTFRYSEVVALDLYGDISVPGLAAVRVDPVAPLADFLWIGLRDTQLFGYPRAGWELTLGEPSTRDLVLAGPHPLTPAELVPSLDRDELWGLSLGQSFETGGEWARIYRVDPESIGAGQAEVALHLSPDAALAWLDLAGGTRAGDAALAAANHLATAGAVIIGPDREPLARRLSGIACLEPIAGSVPEAARIVPASPACPAG